jgi:DNA-binding MarR family transcriptional regulator
MYLAQYICLQMLNAAPHQSNAEMARAMGVTPQAMNGVLRRMQTGGLIDRPDTVSSGRPRPASLTGYGRRTLERVDADFIVALRLQYPATSKRACLRAQAPMAVRLGRCAGRRGDARALQLGGVVTASAQRAAQRYVDRGAPRRSLLRGVTPTWCSPWISAIGRAETTVGSTSASTSVASARVCCRENL